MSFVQSVNVGVVRSLPAKSGRTGIDKQPVQHPVELRAPGPKGRGGSGVVGDRICDKPNHGGDDQAVYAYAREDLDAWERDLGRSLRSGMFGENLTTTGVDVTGALIGERWAIGSALLEVSVPRIPCVTFETWLGEKGWIKTFTRHAVPGAYLRVIEPGEVRAGDSIEVRDRPEHDVTIGMVFRAVTLEPELLPGILAAEALPEETKETARKRT